MCLGWTYQGNAATSAVVNFASSDTFASNIFVLRRGTATAVASAFMPAPASAGAAAIEPLAAAAVLALPAVLA